MRLWFTRSFLNSNFYRVLNAVCFLLGNSPESKFYMATFRNTLFNLHRQVGAEWLGLRNVGVLIREKIWLENSLSQLEGGWECGGGSGYRAGLILCDFEIRAVIIQFIAINKPYLKKNDRLCGLVVRVSGYRCRGLGFDSRRYQIFSVVVGLERGPLSLVRSIEELLE